ncbi:hypothetical protein [Streptomyces sp. NPDC059893]|uniref:hypothetical protein n=1 Tax=Streptomyces sp. NPDC059893 TaxID=3346990 RepID=UPI00364CA638
MLVLRHDRVRLDTGVRSRIRGAPTSPPALAADERAEHREGSTGHDGPLRVGASVAAAVPLTHT